MKEPSALKGETPAFAGGAGEDELSAHAHWQRTSPFAIWFFMASTLKGMFAGGAQMAGSFGTLAVMGSQRGLAGFVGGAIGLLALGAITGTVRYFFFRYSLQPDRVRIRQGVFKKTDLNVHFERIQGVTVEQSLVFRLLGLVTVGFDTAGSAGQEGQLPAVSPRFATALRARIERERKARQVPAADPDAAPTSHVEPSERLVHLGNGDMVRIGLADRSVLAGLAVAPFLGQMVEGKIREWAETQLRHLAAEFQELNLLVAGSMVAGALAVVLVLALMATIASAFFRYHDFTLFAASSDDGNMRFRSLRGLFTRRETVVMRTKIQQLRLSQSLVFRWFGRFHLRALPAGGSIPATSAQNAAQADDNLHVPALAAETVRPLAAKVFAEEGERLSLLPAEDAFEGISPAYIGARLRVVGVVPALLTLVALYPFFGPISLWCLAWVPLTGLVAWQKWRRHAYMHTDEGLAVRTGLLGFKVDACLLRKAQTVGFHQSPLQRRKGLATLDVGLASGSVTLLYIPYAKACRLRDYILYKIESSRGPWH